MLNKGLLNIKIIILKIFKKCRINKRKLFVNDYIDEIIIKPVDLNYWINYILERYTSINRKNHNRRCIMNIIEQFNTIINPSTTLGALTISIVASLIVGFFTGKTVSNRQKGENVQGDMIQNSKVNKE